MLRVFQKQTGSLEVTFKGTQWHPMCAELLRAKFITGPTSFVKFYENNHPGAGDGQECLGVLSAPRVAKSWTRTERLDWWCSTALRKARPEPSGRFLPLSLQLREEVTTI